MIIVNGLTKYYGRKCAVDNVSFQIKKGEVFGLLGPNGAGKTTIIKMLITLSRPTGGNIFINDINVLKEPDRIKRLIGVVPQERNLDRELTVYENMLIYGMLYGLERLPERIEKVLAGFGLISERDTAVEKISGGMQRRLLIARAMLPQLQILFMDEPTIGLDPQIRRQIWEIIRDISGKGNTIFITTHYMDEANALCDRVGILSKGRLIDIDTPLNLKNKIGRYVVETRGHNGRLDYIFCESRQDASGIAEISGNGAVIRPVTLEDVFIKLTGEPIER